MRAAERRNLEDRLPANLRYVKGWPQRIPTLAEASVIQNSHHWVAVLRGDVNGSWASATPNVENLTNDQFLQLVGVSSGSV